MKDVHILVVKVNDLYLAEYILLFIHLHTYVGFNFLHVRSHYNSAFCILHRRVEAL